MKTYEVVLFENKDGTEKYVQVWRPGEDTPTYKRYHYSKFFFLVWRLDWGVLYYFQDYNSFCADLEKSKRIDTKKFPDLDKIKKYNEANNITPVQVIKQPPVRP